MFCGGPNIQRQIIYFHYLRQGVGGSGSRECLWIEGETWYNSWKHVNKKSSEFVRWYDRYDQWCGIPLIEKFGKYCIDCNNNTNVYRLPQFELDYEIAEFSSEVNFPYLYRKNQFYVSTKCAFWEIQPSGIISTHLHIFAPFPAFWAHLCRALIFVCPSFQVSNLYGHLSGHVTTHPSFQ